MKDSECKLTPESLAALAAVLRARMGTPENDYIVADAAVAFLERWARKGYWLAGPIS